MLLHELIEPFPVQCSCCGGCELPYYLDAMWVYICAIYKVNLWYNVENEMRYGLSIVNTWMMKILSAI